ncbi:MAG: 16S rRNA (uracil(1498)-N(3))-methyltransferase [Alphaproteobacteria bacterium]|nr:16S rRNA (uracil(1498)-N(3))-methyltransferase [Alphaproteobacteria bacterium]
MIEYTAERTTDGKSLIVKEKTNHTDPSNNIVLFFAPIKKTDELLNMVTQLGVCEFQPVITDRTVARHINWQRMQKIVIEASEQSYRNSVPKILPPIKFADMNFSGVVVADERFAHEQKDTKSLYKTNKVFVGPEGGFSPEEFKKMDSFGVIGLDLGKTILRAEVAGVVAVSKVLN